MYFCREKKSSKGKEEGVIPVSALAISLSSGLSTPNSDHHPRRSQFDSTNLVATNSTPIARAASVPRKNCPYMAV